MKTHTYTLLLLLLPTIAKPLGSATKVWYPENLIENTTTPTKLPHYPVSQPLPAKPHAFKKPTLKVSKFWHAKLNKELPPHLEQLETQLRKTYPNATLVISSGYRSKRYNNHLGRKLGFVHNGGRVARNSAHTHGKAVDLYATYIQNGKRMVISHQTVAKHAKKIFRKTLVYNDHVHVEVQ